MGAGSRPCTPTRCPPLSAVIPGYDELPSDENGDEAAFVARYEAAIELANLVQTGLLIDATENDGWSPEQVTATP